MTGYPKAEIDPDALRALLDAIKAGQINSDPSKYVIMTTLRDKEIKIGLGPAAGYRKAIKDNLWMIK